MKWILTVALSLTLLSLSSPGQDRPPAGDSFMKGKLHHAHGILDALALGNLEGIAHHAQSIDLLTRERSWQVLQTSDYLRHSGELQRSATLLTRAAKEDNLDGAMLAYFQMTMNCVNCHRYVRDQRKR